MFRCLTIAPAVILLSLTGCRSTTDDRLDRISARLDELDKKITALDAGVSGKSDSALFAANINQPNPMSGPCYDKLSKVKEPPPNPTREQARAYVREIMAVSAGQNSFSSMDPQVRMLYGIGPENWDLLLPYTETNHYAKTVLAELTPLSAKDKVLAQLRRHPALITVVLRNGWVGDAGDSIFELIENSGDRYPPECAPAIPFLAETAEGRKRLTECFTNNPRCFFIYDTLRLRKDINVKDTVETAWENFKGSNDWMLKDYAAAAAEYGNQDALEYLIKSFLSGSPASLIHSPGAYMAIPRLTNQPLDQKTLAGWYERSKDNLVFDSKQKKFIAQDSPDK